MKDPLLPTSLNVTVGSTRLESESKMAFSKLSDFELKAVKHHFQDWCRQNYRKDFSVLITGKTGVGKSSLVNALVGRSVAKEGHKLDPLTVDVTAYCAVIEGTEVRVWDSPGLQDGTDNEQLYLADIAGKITGELDLVIYCLKMDDTRFYSEDKKTIQILTQAFGKELWKNAVIALTFANKVEDPSGGDKEAFFLEKLEIWREAINSFFRDKLEIDSELLQSLPIVPTGYYRQRASLPNCENWLSSFWLACYDVARGSAAFNLYRINRARIRFPGCESLASLTGETESQISPSTEIPAIELGKEEQDSFWKKTWDMFKEYCLKTSVIVGIVGTVGFTVLKMLK